MKLLASLTSPYARKIRIVLAEKALPFELVVDSPWEANTRVPEVNPLGKVPVLVADSGETFFDSPVIAGYLETVGALPALLPTDALDAVRVRQTEALADGVTDAAVTALLESRRPDGERRWLSINSQPVLAADGSAASSSLGGGGSGSGGPSSRPSRSRRPASRRSISPASSTRAVGSPASTCTSAGRVV